MNKYIAAAAALIAGLLSITHADAQTARVVTTCGSTSPFPSPHTGSITSLYVDATGTLCSVGGGGGGGGTSSSFGATFPTVGTAAGFEYLSSPPTLTTGQMVAGQTDVNGNLKTIAQGVAGGVPLTGGYHSAGTGQYAVSINSSTALPTIPSGTLYVEICLETAAARYTDDGATTPTSSIGIPVPAGTCWQVAGSSLLSAFRIIGAGATIDVSYYK